MFFMKSLYEFFFGKEEEELPPFPGMQPFSVEVRTKKPTDDEIDKIFAQLMKELDFETVQRKKFEAMSAEEKWKFIQSQQDHEKRVPTPEWIVAALNDHFDIHFITSIGLNLRTARLTWVDRFCNEGGHILLVRELVRQKAYHQLFLNNFCLPPEPANEILKALKAVVDTRQGSQSMLLFVKAIEVIVCSINVFDHKQFETIIYILLPYVFMEDGPRLLIRAFRKLAENNNHRSPFRIFADEITAGGDSIFITFLSGLYHALSERYDLRLDLAVEYQKAGIPSVLRKINKEIEFADAIESDLNEVSLVYQGQVECFLSPAQFGQALTTRPAASILPCLLAIDRNGAPDVNTKTTDYLKAFLARYRLALLNGVTPDEALQTAHEFAMSGAKQPEAVGGQNHFAQYLAKEYGFASDTELREMSLPEVKGGLKAELAAAKAEIAELRNIALDAETLQKDLEAEKATSEKLRQEITRINESQVLAENEQLRARIAQLELELQAHKFESEELKQVEQLRAENARLTQENAGIQAQLAEAQELARATPKEFTAISPSKIPALVEDLKGIKKDSPEPIGVRIQKVIDDALAYEESFNAERNLQTGQFQQLQKIYDSMMKSLSESGSKYIRQSETTAESTEGKYRRFPWRILESAEGIWDKVNEVQIDSFDSTLDESFAAREVPEGKILSQQSYNQYAKALERSGLSPEELIKGIKLERFSINVASLEILQHLPTSPLELQKIRAVTDRSSLSNPELFAVLLDEIPNWRNSVINMLQYHRFDDEIAVVQSQVAKTEATIKQVNNSKWLPKLLKTIMITGNFLNGDSAKSYSILCLGNMKTFKTNDGRTLANVVADIVGDTDIDVEKLRQAAALDIVQVSARLRGAQAALVRRPVSPFTVSAARRLTNILKSCSIIMDQLLDLSKQVGVEYSLPGAANVLQVILNAIQDVQRGIKENKTFRAAPVKVDTSAPVKRELKVIEDDRERGIITTMINALKAPVKPAKQQETEELSDFQIAFSRVRKNISKN